MLPYLLFQWPLIKRPSILPNKRLVRRRSLNFCLLTYEILRKYSIFWLSASLQCTDLAQNVFRVNFIHFLHSCVCKFWHPVLSQVFHMFTSFFLHRYFWTAMISWVFLLLTLSIFTIFSLLFRPDTLLVFILISSNVA